MATFQLTRAEAEPVTTATASRLRAATAKSAMQTDLPFWTVVTVVVAVNVLPGSSRTVNLGPKGSNRLAQALYGSDWLL
jgi:hypothetical protein